MTPNEERIERVARVIHARFLARASNGNPDADEAWEYVLTERARDEYRDDARHVLDAAEGKTQ